MVRRTTRIITALLYTKGVTFTCCWDASYHYGVEFLGEEESIETLVISYSFLTGTA